MNTLDRARSALERNDPARALVFLVRGLRMEPEEEEMLDLFLHIYTRRFSAPGLESDLFRALEFHPQREQLLRFVLEELESIGKADMAATVREGAEEREWKIAPPVRTEEELPSTQTQVSVEEITEIKIPTSSSPESDKPEDPEVPGEGSLLSNEEMATISAQVPEDQTRGKEKKIEASESAERVRTTLSRRRKIPKKGMLGFATGLTGLVLILVALVFGWHHSREVARKAEIEEAMLSLDPIDPEQVHRTLDRLSLAPRAAGDQSIREMRGFLNALLSLEEDRGAWEQWENEPETPWGIGAAALGSVSRQDWEEAMAFSHLLDRREGQSLPALFVRGRICEARGEWECALSRYNRVRTSFPDFLPAYTGAIRVALRRYDRASFESERERFYAHRPGHPYSVLRWIEPFGEIDYSGEEPDVESAVTERFLREWSHQEGVLYALQSGNLEAAHEGCLPGGDGPNERLPGLDLLCARVAALSGEAERTRSFLRSAAREDATEAVHRILQRDGAGLLLSLGRADWAMSFVIPVEPLPPGLREEASHREFVANRERVRPESYRIASKPYSEEVGETLLVRAEVLRAAGATTHARNTLQNLLDGIDKELDPEIREDLLERARALMVRTYLVDGRLPQAKRAVSQLRTSSMKGAVLAKIAFLEGEHEVGLQHLRATNVEEPWLFRVQILTFIALGRAREARALLEGRDWIRELGLLTFRSRVLVRVGERDLAEGDAAPLALQDLHSVDHLLDLGARAFWLRNLEESQRLLGKARDLAPNHPEVHWKLGLIARVEGNVSQARHHFRLALRGDEGSVPMLVEIGRVQLEYERYDLAREVFLLAALRDRRNLEAIEGLGLSYLHGDRQRGARDLEEVLSLVPPTDRNATARGELNRWIAIVIGSREGEEEARVYLRRARELSGDRPENLIEEARYYHARKDYETSRSKYARALQRNPTIPEIHLGLAEVTLAMGDRDTALDYLRRVEGLLLSEEAQEMADRLFESLEGSR